MIPVHFGTLFYSIIPQIYYVGKGTVRIVQMTKMIVNVDTGKNAFGKEWT